MKHLGIKRTPVYLHPGGHVRMRDILTKGHKARERRTVATDVEDQREQGEAVLSDELCDSCMSIEDWGAVHNELDLVEQTEAG